MKSIWQSHTFVRKPFQIVSSLTFVLILCRWAFHLALNLKSVIHRYQLSAVKFILIKRISQTKCPALPELRVQAWRFYRETPLQSKRENPSTENEYNKSQGNSFDNNGWPPSSDHPWCPISTCRTHRPRGQCHHAAGKPWSSHPTSHISAG